FCGSKVISQGSTRQAVLWRGEIFGTAIEWSALFHFRLTGVGIEMVAGLGLGNAVIEDMRRWQSTWLEIPVRMIGRLERNSGGWFFLGKLGQTADGISLVQPDQADPLGVAADRPGIGDPGADEDSSSGGEHDLVGIRHLGHGHNGAVAVTGLDIDEPFAATVLR